MRTTMNGARRCLASVAIACSLAIGACGGSSSVGIANDGADGSAPASPFDAAPPIGEADGASSLPPSTGVDAAAPQDAASPPTIDASLPPDPTDGTPTPAACTQARGKALSGSYGRLDGFVASARCGKVDDHLHLQVRMNGEMYDIAVNLDTLYAERDVAMPDGAWSEGWHTSGIALDYPSDLGLHANEFTQPSAMSDLATRLQQELAGANHISIFAQGYDSLDGAHDIHRRGRGAIDGAIVLHPLAPVAHLVLFRFTTDNF